MNCPQLNFHKMNIIYFNPLLSHECIITDLLKIQTSIHNIMQELKFSAFYKSKVILNKTTNVISQYLFKNYFNYQLCEMNIIIYKFNEKYIIEFNRNNPDSQMVFNIQYKMILNKLNNLNIIIYKLDDTQKYELILNDVDFDKLTDYDFIMDANVQKKINIDCITNLVDITLNPMQDISEQGIIELCRICDKEEFFKLFVEKYAISMLSELLNKYNILTDNIKYCLVHLLKKTINSNYKIDLIFKNRFDAIIKDNVYNIIHECA
jgi:hypothetical protein